jgi:hypothetical protein
MTTGDFWRAWAAGFLVGLGLGLVVLGQFVS